jgi:ABC-2 type transport system permease protein
MTTPPEVLSDSHGTPSVALTETRPLYWSVRRELWENRSIYLVPLIGIGVILFGFLISLIRLPQKMRGLPALGVARQHEIVITPYNFAAGMTVVMAFIVGFFYCLDALHGERRDRSILFWKSLPVSDRTTVLAKAAIPLAVLPLLSLVIILTAQLVMLVVSTTVLVGSGINPAVLWSRLPIFQMPLALIYCLLAIALWHAPIYAWLLLVSGWAKRATFLWAVMPWLVMAAFERGAFGTSVVGKFLQHRLIGWFTQAVEPKTPGNSPLASLTPGTFLSTPSLWIGLAFAALFLAAAVRMRRNREPI